MAIFLCVLCGKFVFRRSFVVYRLEHWSIRTLNLFRSLSATLYGGLGFRYSCFCPSRQASRLVRQFFWRIYPPKAESTHQLTNSLINQLTIFLCVFVPSWQKTTVLICVNPRLKKAVSFGAEGGLVRHRQTNPCLFCFESCPPSADSYFGYLNLSASGGFV